MTDDQVRAKADRYCGILGGAGTQPRACDPDVRGPNALQLASHSMWMCRQIPRLMVEEKGGQAREWLRFVEGVLWSAGALSFAEMASDGMSPSILRTQ
jgi:hypothetical protein